MFKQLASIIFITVVSAPAFAIPFNAKHVLVVEEHSGEVLLEKNASAVVPIASLTKLMTAMVVLDANQDMSEKIVIDDSDVDTIKHSTSRVPVGISMSKTTALELALMSSDNRAAAALARTYPGSSSAFIRSVRRKIKALGLTNTHIEEPTGLSPKNTSSAADMVRLAIAASKYPEIARITTSSDEAVEMNGREVNYRNTNKFVGKKGWSILLSKTGFTNEAGRCIVMGLRQESNAGDKNVVMVLLNAGSSSARASDALKIKKYLNLESGVKGDYIAQNAAGSKKISSKKTKKATDRKFLKKKTSKASAKKPLKKPVKGAAKNRSAKHRKIS